MTNSEPSRLSGKIACVTAAGQGIGRAIAERLIQEGAEVHVSDLNADLLDGINGASANRVDATDEKAVAAWLRQLPRIDVMVHAVGYVHQGSVEDCTAQEWRQTQAITLDSAFYMVKHTVPQMKKDGGAIILIASIASSIKGYPRRAAYGAAKGGVIGLMKACAADYLGDQIRVNAICPGVVNTPSLRKRIDDLAAEMGGRDLAEKWFLERQPAGRFAEPEEIAGTCAWLASQDAEFVTGQTLQIDGGITI